MGNRTDLQTLLEALLGSDHVYFQPPPTFQMQYPCIVYERSRIITNFANNLPYKHAKQYKLTVIDEDPDSLIPGKVAELPACRFSTAFKSDNLNHDTFTITY